MGGAHLVAMPEVCVDVARTMANGGALSASSAARGLKARRRPTDSVLADTGKETLIERKGKY